MKRRLTTGKMISFTIAASLMMQSSPARSETSVRALDFNLDCVVMKDGKRDLVVKIPRGSTQARISQCDSGAKCAKLVTGGFETRDLKDEFDHIFIDADQDETRGAILSLDKGALQTRPTTTKGILVLREEDGLLGDQREMLCRLQNGEKTASQGADTEANETPAQTKANPVQFKLVNSSVDGINDADGESTLDKVLSQTSQRRSPNELVVCTHDGNLIVRNWTLKTILFPAERGEVVQTIKDWKKRTKVNGKVVVYAYVNFPARGQKGWVAEKFIVPRSQCQGTTAQPTPVTPPVTPVQPPAPVATPAPTPRPQPVATPAPTPRPASSFNPLAPSCALTKVLVSAKKHVASRWWNRSTSGGQCALGVRGSLQSSGVGGIQEGLGNAIDYINTIKKYGYIDAGTKDISKAPAGAVIVFSGPRTAEYFRTGHMSRPYGNYVGHVAIKGGDGWYYTDGRTREPAIGWSGGVNRSGIRNVAAIFVPGPSLVEKYAGRCQ